MGRATAPGAAAARQRGMSGAGQDRAADALRVAWGGACDIGSGRGRRVAQRRDGGDLLAGSTPDELTVATRAGLATRRAR